MESDWTEEIINEKAKVLLLTDQTGGVVHWAAALIAGQSSWERVLLNNPTGPIIIKLNRSGSMMKISGEANLRKRRDQIKTKKIVRMKKQGLPTRSHRPE